MRRMECLVSSTTVKVKLVMCPVKFPVKSVVQVNFRLVQNPVKSAIKVKFIAEVSQK